MFTDGGACSSMTVPCDDLDLAMTGITGPLWVTRLRAFLPAGALANDIILEAAPSQEPVSSFHTTSTYTDPKYNPCPNSNGAGPNQSGPPQGGCACRTAKAPRNRLGDGLLFGVGAVLAGLSLRRRRR
jgi:MYXO-CTERM domain-containing protein